MGQKQDPRERESRSGLSEYVQAKHAISELEAELQAECQSVFEEHLVHLGDAMEKPLNVKAIEAYVYEDKHDSSYVWCGVKLPIDTVATLYVAYLLEENGPCSAGVTVVLTDKKNADKQWRQCQIPENIECKKWYPGGSPSSLRSVRHQPFPPVSNLPISSRRGWVCGGRGTDLSLIDSIHWLVGGAKSVARDRRE